MLKPIIVRDFRAGYTVKHHYNILKYQGVMHTVNVLVAIDRDIFHANTNDDNNEAFSRIQNDYPGKIISNNNS